ncbi:late embryogenesis abundant protein [Striga asiatica]|uniref:Late embryogenesis abundant protein n=1 Tax=Striga asiatica TaxID=4170 RepID=A0A5A7QL13_STRAF|nr:late embryogenesis abundant protein [Striga asiatica]
MIDSRVPLYHKNKNRGPQQAPIRNLHRVAKCGKGEGGALCCRRSRKVVSGNYTILGLTEAIAFFAFRGELRTGPFSFSLAGTRLSGDSYSIPIDSSPSTTQKVLIVSEIKDSPSASFKLRLRNGGSETDDEATSITAASESAALFIGGSLIRSLKDKDATALSKNGIDADSQC